jgi:hypothetical protein
MRTVLLVLGALAALTGVWWGLQGTLSVFPSGQMAGKIEWAYRGGGAFLVGAALIVVSVFLKRRPRAD